MATKKVRYYTKTYANTTCFIFEFIPDATNNIYELCHGWNNSKQTYGKNVLSSISNGYLVSQGYKAVAKINSGFFYSSSYAYYDATKPSIGLAWRKYEGNLSNETGSLDRNGWHLCLNEGSKTPYMTKGYLYTEANCDPYWALTLSYTLVVDGVKNIQVPADYSSFTSSNPRTLIGWKSDGTNVWVVTGGRGINGSGLTANQSADLMLSLGCVGAINADGGGSSEMIVNGQIKNKPTDGGERSIATAFVFYSKDTIQYVGENEPIVDEVYPWEGFNVFDSAGQNKKIDKISCYDSDGNKRDVDYIAVYNSEGRLSGKYGNKM